MPEFQDFDAGNGWIIEASRIEEMYAWAAKNNHASCYFQRVDFRMDGKDHVVICVIDLHNPDHPTLSVTNDAEFVVGTIFRIHGDYPIIYRDTEGNWDEMRHREGNFACFRHLNTRVREDAVEKVVLLHEQDRSGVQ